jgi:hypothetical protein
VRPQNWHYYEDLFTSIAQRAKRLADLRRKRSSFSLPKPVTTPVLLTSAFPVSKRRNFVRRPNRPPSISLHKNQTVKVTATAKNPKT